MAAPMKKADEIIQEEEIFLAVIVADSYDKKLQPCTLERPRVLLPLANNPLIDYTLAFLSLAGIQEVIVYCTAYAQQIKDYISASQWHEMMTVKVITNEEASSVGDALRDLDEKHMISTDFVLVQGDLVANLDLKTCMQRHKQTREGDKDAILTKVMKRCPPGHRIMSDEDRSLYALNKSTNQILYHKKVSGLSKIKIPTELIRSNKDLQLRYDLLDCQVTLCAAMIPSLLSDNFDYQTLDDLVHGVLGNQEILGHTMHMQVLEEGYAARATDFYAYKTLSLDLIDKWAYPFSPERAWSKTNNGGGDFNFGNKYISDSKLFSNEASRSNVHSLSAALYQEITAYRSAVLDNNIVIGRETAIGDNTIIRNSVIGNNCTLGANVVISDSFIWDDVVIEDGCEVHNGILCEKVILYNRTKLRRPPANLKNKKRSPDFILDRQVELGPDISVTDSVCLTSTAVVDEWGESSTKVFSCGGKQQSKAHIFTQPSDDTDDESDESSVKSDVSDSNEFVTPDTELFYDEVLQTLQRASSEKISAENIVLDINSLKHAYNIQINEVNHMLIQAVLDRPIETDTTSAQLLTKLKPLLKTCLGVFSNYYRSVKSQQECLQGLEEYALDDTHSICRPILCQVLMYLYQNDVLDEEVISTWYEQLSASQVKTEVGKLIDWFNEADSESESD